MFIFRKRIGFDNAFMSRIFRMQNLKPAEVIWDLCICTLINQMFCKIHPYDLDQYELNGMLLSAKIPLLFGVVYLIIFLKSVFLLLSL